VSQPSLTHSPLKPHLNSTKYNDGLVDYDNLGVNEVGSLSSSPQSSSHGKVLVNHYETEQPNTSSSRSSQSEDVIHISPPSASSRSAFVPFSQVHGRKEMQSDVPFNLSRIPSINTTQSSSAFLSLSSSASSPISPNSPVSTSSIGVTDSSSGVRQIIPNSALMCQSVTSVPSQPGIPTSSLPSFTQTNTEYLMDNFVSMDRVIQPPGSLSINTLCSTNIGQVGTVTNTCTESIINSHCSQTLTQASPTTPKKGKSRFTPIRPKASPQKTVSTILKEQKVGYEAGSYDKSKPVAALLKEKRAREAEAMAQLKTTLSLSPGAPNQHNIQIPNLQNFAALQNKLDVGKPGEFLIILNAAPQTTPVTVVNPSPTLTQTVVTSAISSAVTSVVRSKSEMGRCVITPVSYNNTSRSRTNSSSELEVESLLPAGVIDDDIADVNMDEKPSKLAKIVDSDQVVSSRPGSRCSLDRETPSSFGRKRKFHNNANIGHHKRINSTEDTDDEVLIDPKDYNKEIIRRAKSCSLENPERDLAIINKENMLANETHYCPDISILEIDALSDDITNSEHHQLRSDSSHSCQQVQSAAVGVNSLSLRNSQRQLLKEKEALDKRMKYFWNKDDKQKRSQKTVESTTMAPHKMSGISTGGKDIVLAFQDTGQIETDLPCNVSIESMEVGSELPADVADFITDALTGLNTEKDNRNDIETSRIRTEQCVRSEEHT